MLEGALLDSFGIPAALSYKGVINDTLFVLEDHHNGLVELLSHDNVSFLPSPIQPTLLKNDLM